MAFVLEKNMTELIENQKEVFEKIIKLNNKYKIKYFAKEVPFDYRMIDIIVLLNDKKIDYNSISNLKYMSSIEIDILSLISTKNKMSKNMILKLTGLNVSRLDEILSKLEKKMSINKVSDNSYSINKNIRDNIPRYIISYELKLSNWSEALEQAIYNKKFSEYSFVILDADRLLKKDSIIQKYRNFNVGLIEMSDKGDMRILYNPYKNRDIDKHSNFVKKISFLKDYISKNKWVNL